MSNDKDRASHRREFLSTSAKTLAGATAATLLVGGAASATPVNALPNQAEGTVRACHEAWAARDFEMAARLTSPNLVEHAPLLVVQAHQFMTMMTENSGNPPVDDIKNFLSIFPDASVKIEDIFSSGDKVVYRWSGSGTHTKEFLGIPPTGRKATLEGITIARVANGQVVETWRQFDFMGALQQLGLSERALELMEALGGGSPK